MKVSVQELMEASGVKFGTSGARGLAAQMSDSVCYTYAKAFLQYLDQSGDLRPADGVAIAGDLRPSTDRIIEAVSRACDELGCPPKLGGKIPSPAVALYGLANGIPSIMVTGSHIPCDRNGIKFNKPGGEILKDDEAGIRRQVVEVRDGLFSGGGAFIQNSLSRGLVRDELREMYCSRYTDLFASDALEGVRVGVYQHSAVGRELIVQVLQNLGAETTPLGFSEQFIPVDTEAIRPEDARLAREWARQYSFDSIVSTDGDSDRPLISDESGRWLRGDVAGILCAKYLEADSVSVPVSCNTALEKSGWFKEVRRTRIGSPYVIESMIEASAAGAGRVVGYEANGGFLTNSDLEIGGKVLRALPTRDALILIISILLLAKREQKTISKLQASLPARFTASDRLAEFPQERSRAILSPFDSGDSAQDVRNAESIFGRAFGAVTHMDRTDGVRIQFSSEEIIHLRPSGNAPEFRCYTEAASEERAEAIKEACMTVLAGLVAAKP